MSRVRLDRFDPRCGLERGRPRWVEVLWYLIKIAFFLSAIPWPSTLKVCWLRLFGASVGRGVVIKPRVNIHLPWKLTVGDHCWLGEELFILNFAAVTIGCQVCLSQRAFLCTGNHDYRQETFPYRNAPIRIEDGVWIGAGVFIGPGISIGQEAVVAAGSVVTKNLPGGKICSGNPAIAGKDRWR